LVGKLFENDMPVLGLAGCLDDKLENCRYTEVINLRFPHCGIASLAQVSTMGLCPLQFFKLVQTKPGNIPKKKCFTSVQMVHTHTHPPAGRWKINARTMK